MPSIFERARSLLERAGASSVVGAIAAKIRPPSQATPGRGTALPDQALWAQFQRIGGNLSPQQVSSIIREADGGEMRRLCDLANESRQKDGHLQSVLGTRENAIAGLKWDLAYPGQDAKSTRGARQLKFAKDAIRNSGDFRRTLAHLGGAFFPGYGVAETLWDKVDSKIVPVGFRNHAARRFGWDLSSGAFVWRDPGMDIHGVDFLAEYPNRFIVSQPRINGDVPVREGLSRLLVWSALFRNWDLGDWMKLAELAWKPWRTGKYKKNASSKDIADLEVILARMSAAGWASFPDTLDIAIEWPGGASNNRPMHSELFDVLGREMSKAVVGQTLTTEAGKIGSQALGNVHNDVRKDILESDALYLSSVLTRDLVRPLIGANFGWDADVPSFCLITEETADLGAYSTAVATFVKAGLRVPASWVRDEAGIPEPKDGEEVLEAAVAPANGQEPDPNKPADPATGKAAA